MAKNPEHTFISLNNGIKLSFMLYKFLTYKRRFDESKLLSFSAYMRWRNFPNILSGYGISAAERKQVAAQKEIFDYLADRLDTAKSSIRN